LAIGNGGSDSMQTGQAVQKHLDRLDAQWAAVLARLAGIDEARLWQRPGPRDWSIGENLDHAWLVLRSFRRMFTAAWPVMLPVAHLKGGRPYRTEIDDVYARPGFPLNVGWMWSSRHSAEHPAPLSVLQEAIEAEHRRVHLFYEGKDERLLGHAILWDPAIGLLNLVQALQVGVHHDAHHFATVYRLLGEDGRPGE
jgi:hypothetical protein